MHLDVTLSSEFQHHHMAFWISNLATSIDFFKNYEYHLSWNLFDFYFFKNLIHVFVTRIFCQSSFLGELDVIICLQFMFFVICVNKFKTALSAQRSLFNYIKKSHIFSCSTMRLWNGGLYAHEMSLKASELWWQMHSLLGESIVSLLLFSRISLLYDPKAFYIKTQEMMHLTRSCIKF